MSYTKLQNSIIASTVWAEPYPTRIVWIAMLAMANRDGHVNASIPGLAHIARVTRTEAEEAISVLCAPDPDSRSKVAEGRRLEEIEGGWNIINYIAIRDSWTDDDKREYQRKWAANKRAAEKAATQNPTHVEVVSKSVEVCRSESKQIEAPAPTPDVNNEIRDSIKTISASEPAQSAFTQFWSAFPIRKDRKRCVAEWDRLHPDDALVSTILQAVRNQTSERERLSAAADFAPRWKNPLTWLRGRCWEDELTAPNVVPISASPRKLSAAEIVREASQRRIANERVTIAG